MAYTFFEEKAAAPSTRTTQYFEMLGNRAIYDNGWMSSCRHGRLPWENTGADFADDVWELYNLEEDFSQSRNLAADEPEKLAAMQAVFDSEARRYQVYPVHDTGAMQRSMQLMRFPGAGLSFTPQKTLWGPDVRLPLAQAPPIFMLPAFNIEAQVRVPEQGANGVIVAAGSQFGGWSFYLHEGVPVAVAAISPLDGGQSRIAADRALPPGEHSISYAFQRSREGGVLSIAVNGEQWASGPVVKPPHMMAGGGETFDTGRDSNDAVSLDYADEGEFTGEILRIDIATPMPQRH